jgi:hypothetical protein
VRISFTDIKADPRATLLPPDLFNRFINDAFWRGPQRIPGACASSEVPRHASAGFDRTMVMAIHSFRA